jgi:HAD superfamily hydrolase (TIGR01509 family)
MASSAPITEISAVVFDLDGVLLDSEPLHYRAAARVFASAGKALGLDTYRRAIGRGALETWTEWKGAYSLPGSVSELIALDEHARLAEIRLGVDPIPEATLLARRLKARGMPLAIASSSTPETIDAELAGIGVTDVFSLRVSVEQVNRAKPEPDVYVRAAEILGVPPQCCLAIEDSPVGVQAAKAAGMTCFAVPTDWTRDGDFREADAVLASLRYFPLLFS